MMFLMMFVAIHVELFGICHVFPKQKQMRKTPFFSNPGKGRKTLSTIQGKFKLIVSVSFTAKM